MFQLKTQICSMHNYRDAETIIVAEVMNIIMYLVFASFHHIMKFTV
jgi:hypothetical protein